MWLYYDLPVYKKLYDFVLKIFKIIKKFPREYKYTLWQDMKKESINLVRYIYRANISNDRKWYLMELLDNVEILKFELRLCKDLNIIWKSDYVSIFKEIEEISKQVNWWLKYSK